MKEKIVHLMKSEGLTSSRLAEILETQPSRISHIVSGRNKPSFDLLQQILRRFPKINPDWLLLDSEKMYRDSDDGASPQGEPFGGASDGEASPIDLFEFGGSVALDSQVRGGEVLDVQDDLFLASKFSQNNGAFSGQNRAQNSAQNGGQFTPQNSGQNRSKNGGQNFQNSPSVQRIIVLYSDGTFRTYSAR